MENELLYELRQAYGDDAEFREGQLEAITGIIQGKRTLVVQRTGWGKSLVYFLATRLLRKRGKGLTIVISPLLALMDNQMDSADKFELSTATINSNNQDDWDMIIEALNQDIIDVLFISPERLSNTEFQEVLMNDITGNVGLFVVDEAHCISDWGHDFRPDYQRIIDIIRHLPSNVPVLATTATANNRVVNDIKKQLGENIYVSRGKLMRETLEIQVIKLSSKEERLAWLCEHINDLPGMGIIYCLTIKDCDLVYKWLVNNGICAELFYSTLDSQEKSRIQKDFMDSKFKVLIATVAFGMGIDKADIGFVIHFQKPGNVIAYYQQIGRAGRGIDKAYAILFAGAEDDEINHYFIESAFPTEAVMNDVIQIIQENSGLKKYQIVSGLNLKKGKIEACLKYLLVSGDIYIENQKYYKSLKKWMPDLKHSEEITKTRYNELDRMNQFIHSRKCYMEFIALELDDDKAVECGKCSNCLGYDIISTDISKESIIKAQQFIREDFNVILPRKKWPDGVKIEEKNKIAIELQCQEGRVLSNYGDAGWGRDVFNGKYIVDCFSKDLVEASYVILKYYIKDNDIKWVTNVPSLRYPNLVRDFTRLLAEKLGLPYVESINKVKDAICQKKLNNNFKQFENAFDSFEANNYVLSGNVLLVDDMVDSRWTMTVCGYKLIKNGSGQVYPFALANSAGRNGDE